LYGHQKEQVAKLSRNESLLYRSNKNTLIHIGHIDETGLYNNFFKELNKEEYVYQFPITGILGTTQKPIATLPNKYKNILSFPDVQTNKVFKEIIHLIKEFCIKFNLSYENNRYYLSSDLVDSHTTNFWYDQSSASRPALFGVLNLGDSISNIKINEVSLPLNPGDIIISEAGNKITYLDSFKSLNIQVMPVSELKGQYLEKWIPLC
jgi:hypothetical protein